MQINNKTIETQLSNLTTKQKRHFSWLCCIRALPFLSVQRNFIYWDESVRQKYLQTIFYALDRLLWYNNGFSHAYAAEIEGKILVQTLFTAADTASPISAKVVIAVANAIQGRVVSVAENLENIKPEFQQIILADLEAIRQKKLGNLNADTSVYGNLWQAVQTDLTSAGCGSWAKLYAGFFSHRFYFDKNALKQRINEPKINLKAENPTDYGEKSQISNWILNNIKIDQALFLFHDEITERGREFMSDISNHYTFNGPVGSVGRHDTVINNQSFHANTAELRELFNELAGKLDGETAQQAKRCAKDLIQAAECSNLAEARKKGLLKRTLDFIGELGDETSPVSRKVAGVKCLGGGVARLIAKAAALL
ncbi:MAG: hypothetical protein FWH04_00830 [Oscillospiraceae bacterium]|nr:hypothetical protein [Oscillospiraceae bacterium]